VKLRRAVDGVVTEDRLLPAKRPIPLDSVRRQRIVLHPRIDGELLEAVDACARSEDEMAHAIKT